jgi:DNA gyrase/topoisomerase IV subunit A
VDQFQKTMLTRVCLIAAIVFGVAVAGINLWKVREVIVTTRTERDTERSLKEQAQSDLARTRKELTDTQDDLAQTKQNLETTTTERDRLRGETDALTKQNTTLQRRLKETTDQLNNAQAELAAWAASGTTVDQVKSIIAAAKAAQEALEVANAEKEILEKELKKTLNRLAFYEDPTYKVNLPIGLKGTVLVADPKWDFVVLDIGEDDGVLENGELLVNRNGRLVAKIRIQSVQKDQSIANLLDGWKLSDVIEGDLVIPAL